MKLHRPKPTLLISNQLADKYAVAERFGAASRSTVFTDQQCNIVQVSMRRPGLDTLHALSNRREHGIPGEVVVPNLQSR